MEVVDRGSHYELPAEGRWVPKTDTNRDYRKLLTLINAGKVKVVEPPDNAAEEKAGRERELTRLKVELDKAKTEGYAAAVAQIKAEIAEAEEAQEG